MLLPSLCSEFVKWSMELSLFICVRKSVYKKGNLHHWLFQDSTTVLIPLHNCSTHVPFFFPTMTSTRMGAFKVQTSAVISRRNLGGLLKQHLTGGQLNTFKKLSRNVRAVDGGSALYVETADDLNDTGRDELAALLCSLGEVMPVKEADAIRNREIGEQYRIAREKEAAGIVLGDKAASIADRLMKLRGEGGPLKKRRRFAEALASTIEQGQKISFVAAQRRIERVEAEEKEEEDAE